MTGRLLPVKAQKRFLFVVCILIPPGEKAVPDSCARHQRGALGAYLKDTYLNHVTASVTGVRQISVRSSSLVPGRAMRLKIF